MSVIEGPAAGPARHDDGRLHQGRAAAANELCLVARDALDRFQDLEACREREPRLTTDQRAWLLWHHDSYHPARRAWDEAMDELERQLGRSFPDREAHDWKPICIQILTGEAR
jgi:hypothetical protein